MDGARGAYGAACVVEFLFPTVKRGANKHCAYGAAASCDGLSCCLRMTNEAIPNLTAFDEAALDQAFGALEQQAREAAAALNGEAAVEAFRLEWLGRKQGRLNEVSGRWLKAAPAEAKKAAGGALQRAEGGGGGAAGRGCSARGRATRRWLARLSTLRCRERGG